jgi:hypothetical protein
VYAAPIFDRQDGVPLTNRTLGVCAVDGLRARSADLAFDPRLRVLVEALTAHLAPYVEAMHGVVPPAADRAEG